MAALSGELVQDLLLAAVLLLAPGLLRPAAQPIQRLAVAAGLHELVAAVGGDLLHAQHHVLLVLHHPPQARDLVVHRPQLDQLHGLRGRATQGFDGGLHGLAGADGALLLLGHGVDGLGKFTLDRLLAPTADLEDGIEAESEQARH